MHTVEGKVNSTLISCWSTSKRSSQAGAASPAKLSQSESTTGTGRRCTLSVRNGSLSPVQPGESLKVDMVGTSAETFPDISMKASNMVLFDGGDGGIFLFEVCFIDVKSVCDDEQKVGNEALRPFIQE